jgi:hypothetical protein
LQERTKVRKPTRVFLLWVPFFFVFLALFHASSHISACSQPHLQGVNLYIKNLGETVDEGRLRELFTEFGLISRYPCPQVSCTQRSLPLLTAAPRS